MPPKTAGGELRSMSGTWIRGSVVSRDLAAAESSNGTGQRDSGDTVTSGKAPKRISGPSRRLPYTLQEVRPTRVVSVIWN